MPILEHRDIGNKKIRLEKENSNTNKTTFDIKAGLEHYLPSLLQLIEGQFRWTDLTRIFQERFDLYKTRYDCGERFEQRVTLYSLTASLKNNPENIQFVSFIDNVCKSLNNCLNKNEKRLIKTTIGKLLEYDYAFLHYLGELCVLNCIMTSGLYRLEKTEYAVKKGGKAIDFKFKNIQTNEDFFVEVRNLEIRADKLTDDKLIHKYLSSIFQEKLDDTDKSGITDYTLIPVIWGGKDNVNNILRVKEFYETTKFSMDRVMIPRVYMQLKDGDKTYNKFGSILKCLYADEKI